MTTPAQQRAAEAVAVQLRLFGPDPNWCARVALSAALDEAEMVEAIRNAPCILSDGCQGFARKHPECAARAVIDLINGEKP